MTAAPSHTPIAIASLCDLPVGVVRWEAPEPRLTVVVKATFALDGDRAWLAADQAPLSTDEASLFSGDELTAASDFAPYKQGADVLLVGDAHSEHAASALPVFVAVGNLRRSFFAVSADEAEAIPLSSVYLRDSIDVDAAPVCVSPLSPRSPERRAFAGPGPLDEHGMPRGPYCVGFDWRFFNAAPPEQRIDVVPDDAVLRLEGLLPGAPRRRVTLPGMRPHVHLVDAAAARVIAPVVLRCDTLVIDTERAVCSLVWRGVTEVSAITHPCFSVAFAPADAEPSEADVLRRMAVARWGFAVEAPGSRAAGGPAAAHTLVIDEPGRADLPGETRPSSVLAAPLMQLGGSVSLGRGTRLGHPAPPANPPKVVEPREPAPDTGPRSRPALLFTSTVTGEEVTALVPLVAAPERSLPFAEIDDGAALHMPVPAPPGAVVALPFVEARHLEAPSAAQEAPRSRPEPVFWPVPASPAPFLPTPAPAEAPPSSRATPSARPTTDRLSVEAYVAIQAAVWTKQAKLAEALEAHGLDESVYRVEAARLLRELEAEAREGKSERLLRLHADLRRRIVQGS